MSTLKLKMVLLFCLVSMTCMSQKCKNSKKMHRRAQKHFVEEKIEKATKPKPMFSKFSQAGSSTFVRSTNNYYLGFVLAREFGRRIDIMDDNPLVIQFKNDSIITLYPNRSVLGKFSLPVTIEVNRPFYKVSRKQLELFALQPILHVKVYFTSDKVSEEKRGVDDLGTFFDYEILNKNFQSNCINTANCILQL